MTFELGKGFSKRNLWLMLKFYELREKMQTLSAHLSWSHYCELLSIDNLEEIEYYIKICEQQNLSVRKLREKIRAKEYERLPLDTKNKIVNKEESSVVDFVKNPIHIRNNKNLEIVSENVLQRLIMEDIPSFLNELGTGFAFINKEYSIKIGDRYNYIDILLYNIRFKCYVVVELKVTELKKEHIGQIMTYMNYIDRNVKCFDDNKTVGIIICKRDNKYVIDYCSDDKVVSREYELL